MVDDVKTNDDFLARRFSERLLEIHADISAELTAAGGRPEGPPEWDDYQEQRDNPLPGGVLPTPARQEALRRLMAGSPEHVLAVSRWIREASRTEAQE